MKTQIIGVVAVVGAIVFTGCQQSRLMSEDANVRLSAVSELSTAELENVLLADSSSDSTSSLIYGARRDFPLDVKKAAIDRLYDKKEYQTLVSLASDYRIEFANGYDGREKVSPIVLAIRDRFSTTNDWNWLAGTLPNDSSERLLNMICRANGEKFYVWIVHNERCSWAENFSDSRYERVYTPVGISVVDKKITSVECLREIAVSKNCRFATRKEAAIKLLGSEGISGKLIDEIVTTLAVDDAGCHERDIAHVAQAGTAAAKRVGADSVYEKLMKEHSAAIQEENDRLSDEKKRHAFWKSVGSVERLFTECPPKASKGDVFSYTKVYWDGKGRPWPCRAVVKQVLPGGIVIGRDKTYERIKTGYMSDEFRTPCYEDFHFPNRIVVKTKKQYADGDAFDEPYLRYEGVQSFKGEKGRSMSLHVFSPYVIPEKLRW